MKLTPHKLARIKLMLPQEDRDAIDEEIKNGGISSSTNALIQHTLARMDKNSNKGAFGSKGLNRKKKILQQKAERFARLVEIAKSEEFEEKPLDSSPK